MRNGKWFIALFTLLLIAVAVIFGTNEYSWDGTVGITALIPSQAGEEIVDTWEVHLDNDDKRAYIFLPSYADMAQVRLKTNVSNPVFLNGKEITDDMTCKGFQTEMPYKLIYQHRGREYVFSLTFLRSARTPAMYIDTASDSLTYLHEERGNAEPGTLRLYESDGSLHYEGRLDSIKGRGNSTWYYEKKPYNLELNSEADLLGMGAAKRWILLANAADSSQMRNKIAYDLARDLGLAYSPESRWVDLYINGEYVGLYLLSERNEVHEQRVDIAGQGGFLITKDYPWRFADKGTHYLHTAGNASFEVLYSDISEQQLLSDLQTLENAILAEDGIDPETGKHWQDLLDMESWAKKYLLEEVLGNDDASTLSQFYYREETGGKIFAGPVWDMDLTLRGSMQEWLEGQNLFHGNDLEKYGSTWVPTLYRNETFFNCLTELYKTEMLPLLQQLRKDKLYEYTEEIRQSAWMDNLRWGGRELDREMGRVYAYLDQRIEFLNRIWIEKEDYAVVKIYEDNDWVRIVLSPGDSLPAFPEEKASGWYYRGTDIPVEPEALIWEDTEIERRSEAVELEVQPEQETEKERFHPVVQGPVLVFTLLLVGICGTGLKQSWSKQMRRTVGRKK